MKISYLASKFSAKGVPEADTFVNIKLGLVFGSIYCQRLLVRRLAKLLERN